jgi:ketosteroid isomerase-like protein
VAASDLDVVRSLFELFGTDRTEEAFELVTDDLTIVIPPSMSAEPDVYEGREGLQRYLDGFAGMLEDVRFEIDRLVEADDRVVVLLQMKGRGATSGIPAALDTAVAVWLREGRIARMEASPDLDAALTAPHWRSPAP